MAPVSKLSNAHGQNYKFLQFNEAYHSSNHNPNTTSNLLQFQNSVTTKNWAELSFRASLLIDTSV